MHVSATVFVICNQHQQYLDKHNQWVSGKDGQQLYRARHHDEALNTLIELNARDINLRGRIIETRLDDRGRPDVTVGADDSEQPAATVTDQD
ncbi:MAG TPA: hypothetical protein VIN71_12375 [Pseudomonadales bacterium]